MLPTEMMTSDCWLTCSTNSAAVWSCELLGVNEWLNVTGGVIFEKTFGHMGLSENGVSMCISYSNGLSPCSPLKLLFVGIPYFQTNPYEGHSSTMWGKERWCLQWNIRRTGRNSLHLNLQNLRSSINVWGTSVFFKIYLVYFWGPTPLPLPGGIPRAMREHHRTFFS